MYETHRTLKENQHTSNDMQGQPRHQRTSKDIKKSNDIKGNQITSTEIQ